MERRFIELHIDGLHCGADCEWLSMLEDRCKLFDDGYNEGTVLVPRWWGMIP